MSRREEQSLYINARAKLQNMGVPCSNLRTMIVARVAGHLMRPIPADPLPMLEEFIKPPERIIKTHRGEYKVPISMKIAALKAASHPSLISMNSRIKHYAD